MTLGCGVTGARSLQGGSAKSEWASSIHGEWTRAFGVLGPCPARGPGVTENALPRIRHLFRLEVTYLSTVLYILQST